MRLLIICALGLAVLGSCSRREPVAVPKPEAYARIHDYKPVYVSPDSLPLNFEVNTSAESHLDNLWLDIRYPDYDATVYVTFTPVKPDSLEDVISNRLERISLNLSDKSNLKFTDIISDEFSSQLVSSDVSLSTPLQFISTDNDGWVVSGTVFFHRVSQQAALDSLKPMIETIRRDLVHSLSTISRK